RAARRQRVGPEAARQAGAPLERPDLMRIFADFAAGRLDGSGALWNTTPVRFIDECEIRVEAGNGGNGAVAFRREKYVPMGGPAGGDGGRGGDVVFVAASGLSTLHDFTHQTALRAEHGQKGMGKDCYGKAGRDLVVRVPVGTVVYDAASREKLAEI